MFLHRLTLNLKREISAIADIRPTARVAQPMIYLSRGAQLRNNFLTLRLCYDGSETLSQEVCLIQKFVMIHNQTSHV